MNNSLLFKLINTLCHWISYQPISLIYADESFGGVILIAIIESLDIIISSQVVNLFIWL